MEKGRNKKRPVKLSLSEIEAAKFLVQLSSGDFEEDQNSNNNSNSYSVSHNKVDSGGDVVSSSTVLSDSESCFARTNKRYRYVNIDELYRATSPLPPVKARMIKRRK
ncbi:hypothetical protein MtrunA17_Chr4g0051111 [Medicago truncatula]|uniref:Uncharacterized protein n=1 Tax=Medicago truncatula TaxID=3880 RepID=A0A072UPJ5_MEDTR|nr:hypothetical protein MTR_4g094395 [Medicago truncatula]RHN62780.1 hypothetical protein MtrunA17_Chr4g0051111 [Medicago truncatula]